MSNRKLPRGGGTQVALSPELAIAAIGLFSAFSDGESVDDGEAEALIEMLSAIDLYEDYAEEDFATLNTDLKDLIKSEGFEAVVGQAIATVRDEGIQETAFAVAVVVIASDGEVPEEEQEYIDSLFQSLGISENRANAIIADLFSDEGENEEEEEEEEDEDA